MRARWVCKRSEAAVAAAGGIKLGRVLACVGTFILQLRRLRAARAAMATEEVATGDDVATVTTSEVSFAKQHLSARGLVR